MLALALLAVAMLVGSSPWAGIGAGLAVLMEIAALTSHRVGTAIASFILGIGPWWDGFIVFGAVYVVFGFLLVRAGRQMANDQGGARR